MIVRAVLLSTLPQETERQGFGCQLVRTSRGRCVASAVRTKDPVPITPHCSDELATLQVQSELFAQPKTAGSVLAGNGNFTTTVEKTLPRCLEGASPAHGRVLLDR